MKPAQLILIAGPSGSGKSTLSKILIQQLGIQRTALLPLDNYYRDCSDLSDLERAGQDFDHPDAWEHERILDDLVHLKTGAAVEVPIYDFHTHLRRPETTHISPVDYIIAEGIFALCYAEVNALADYRVYVDLDEATALQRRLARDCVARGRSEASIIRQFNQHVAPSIGSHIRPSAVNANHHLDGSVPIDSLTHQLQSLSQQILTSQNLKFRS